MKQIVLALVMMVGMVVGVMSPAASAATCTAADGSTYETMIIPCDEVCPDGGGLDGDGKCSDGSTPNYIWGILRLIINILTAGIGLAAVGGMIYASVLYTTSGADAGQLKESKKIIFDIVIGLLAYALMYAFLNFIIPGGMF